jgi:hypothetical protein
MMFLLFAIFQEFSKIKLFLFGGQEDEIWSLLVSMN